MYLEGMQPQQAPSFLASVAAVFGVLTLVSLLVS